MFLGVEKKNLLLFCVRSGGAQVHLYCDQKIAAEKSELMAKGSEALSFVSEKP